MELFNISVLCNIKNMLSVVYIILFFCNISVFDLQSPMTGPVASFEDCPPGPGPCIIVSGRAGPGPHN